MAERGNPTIRRRLAAELRRLRERAGLTAGEVADQLGWSGSKISRVELAQVGIKTSDLDLLLGLYGIPDPQRGELLALARESHHRGRLSSKTASRIPEEYAEFLHAEAEAEVLRVWDPLIVPGLLQTESYARAIMLGWHSMFTDPPEDIDARIETRTLRRQNFSREPRPQLQFVLDESILLRLMGSPEIMHEQLQRLVQDSLRPNVTLRILPLSGDHPVGTGAFNYMSFSRQHKVPLTDLVHFEHLNGMEREDDPGSIYRYSVAFEALLAKSLDPGRSRARISEVVGDKWS